MADPNYIVFYGAILEDDDVGVFLDFSFLGGVAYSLEEAEKLSADLTNDRSIPGTSVVTKVYRYETMYTMQVVNMATKYFTQIAREMYEAEEIQKKMRGR